MKKKIIFSLLFLIVLAVAFSTEKVNATEIDCGKVTVELDETSISGKKLIIVSPNTSFKFDKDDSTKNELYLNDFKNGILQYEGINFKDNSEKLATGTVINDQNSNQYTVILVGDVDKDGSICTASDIRKIIQYYVYSLTDSNARLTQEQILAADTYENGKLDAVDMARMQQKFSGTLQQDTLRYSPSTKLSLRLDKENFKIGDTVIVSPILTPEKSDVSYTFSSDNTGVATVNSEGKVNILANGTAKITVTAKSKSFSKDLVASITLNVNQTEYSCEFENKLKNIGDKTKIIINPAYTGNIEYQSSNPEVLTVDNSGNVELVGNGNAIITVNCENGMKFNLSYTSTSTVYKVEFDGEVPAYLPVGQTSNVKVRCQPEGSKIIFSSADENIATIDQQGNVTAKGPGVVLIKAQIEGTNANASFELYVPQL